MKGDAVSLNMMLCIPRGRWTCWNQLTFLFKTSAKRCFCGGSSGCQYAAKPGNERTPGIDGFLFTVIVHVPFFIKWKIRFLRDCTRLSKIPEYNPPAAQLAILFQPQFMTIERSDVLNRFMDVP
jgi:hypothetical protein